MKKVLILVVICLLCFGCSNKEKEVDKKDNQDYSTGDVKDLFKDPVIVE